MGPFPGGKTKHRARKKKRKKEKKKKGKHHCGSRKAVMATANRDAAVVPVWMPALPNPAAAILHVAEQVLFFRGFLPR